MKYKCLILDIDDTLINDNHEITLKTKETLIRFQEAGYTLVLASGRPFEGMLEEARILELDKYGSYIISFNGATITRMNDLKRVYEKHMLFEDQETLLPFLRERNIVPLTYSDGEIYVEAKNDYTHIESKLTGMPMNIGAEFFQTLSKPMLKFIGVADPQIIKPVEQELGGHFGKMSNAVTSKPFYLEFFHQDVSKGDAVRHLSEILAIKPEEMIAVGDGNNDITMLQEAGLGIAVANATERLKAVANELTASNNDEGVVAVVEKYFFSDKS